VSQVDLGNRKSGYIGDLQPLDSRQAGRLTGTRQHGRRALREDRQEILAIFFSWPYVICAGQLSPL
jgi:hypothetical protein